MAIANEIKRRAHLMPKTYLERAGATHAIAKHKGLLISYKHALRHGIWVENR